MEVVKQLENLKNIPFYADVLGSMMTDIKALDKKLAYLESRGKIIRLKRGMYVVAPEVSRIQLSIPLIANHLYGPSYVSCHTALRYWGLIPERVHAIRSMTTKRAKEFENQIGRFEYLHASPDYYPIGIRMVTEGGVSYLMASPEKALCDLLVTTPYLNLRYKQELIQYLEEDIRLDMDEFKKLDPAIFEACAEVSKKSVTIRNIANLLR